MSLTGKVAIVTGGSRGIGAGIAKELANRGAFVVITYVARPAAAAQIVENITASGGNALAVQADCQDLEAPKTVVEATLQIDGGIDILVNNAGNGDIMLLKDITLEHYDKVVNINMRFPVFMTQACLPHLRKGGRIVNIGSVISRQRQQSLYSLSSAHCTDNCHSLGCSYGLWSY